MNSFVLVAVCVLLGVVLVLIHHWQQRIEELTRAEALEEIREARERGSDRPLAQHPHIDESACIGCGSCIAACPEEGVLGIVDGVARVIHGARCIGHGLCADACPVDAIKIGLGDLANRSDVPLLDDRLESTAGGIYIAGELGGFALIRVAVEQGVQAIDAVAAELRRAAARRRSSGSDDDLYDVLIVGAGPAGFAASLRAVELGLRYVTIDQDDIGGTVRKYPRRKLTLTGRLTLPLHGTVRKTEFLKEELITFWEGIVERYGIEIYSGVKFIGARRSGEGFLAETSEGAVRVRRIVLALGRRGTPKRLGVPGEESEKVLYQLVDAASYQRERILIVGGGDSAAEAAIGLAAQPGNEVTVSYRRTAFFRLKRRNEERLEEFVNAGRIRVFFRSDVQRIDADEVTLVRQSDEAEGAAGVQGPISIPNDRVFVFAGGEPPYPLLERLGVRFYAGAKDPGDPSRPAATSAAESIA